MTKTETPIEALALHDAAICLDFTNTLGGTRATPDETLIGYADVVAWCRTVDLIGERDAAYLIEAARHAPEQAAAIFRRAIALREAIFRLFSAVAAGQPTDAADRALLNGELAVSGQHRGITAHGAGHAWVWQVERDLPLDRPLWPLADAAARLLTSDRAALVRECASATCAWLFIDHSRNHSRRWCDMADCGNRAKARRHQARRREAKASD